MNKTIFHIFLIIFFPFASLADDVTVSANDTGLTITATATTLTITSPNNTTPYNGNIIVTGF